MLNKYLTSKAKNEPEKMSSYKQKLTFFFVLVSVLCGGQEVSNPENDHIIRIPQNYAQDNELLVQEVHSVTNKSIGDLSRDEIDSKNNNKHESERQVTRELTYKSVVNTKLGDDRILSILTEALHVIKTPKCYKDLNYTIDAIRKQKPWAIASKCIHFTENATVLQIINIKRDKTSPMHKQTKDAIDQRDKWTSIIFSFFFKIFVLKF